MEDLAIHSLSPRSPTGAAEQLAKLANLLINLASRIQKCTTIMCTPPGTPPSFPTPKQRKNKLQAGVDLVGIEPNPGPPKKGSIEARLQSVENKVVSKKRPTKNRPKRQSKLKLNAVGNEYLRSLLFPSSGPTRIPDPTTISTATVDVKHETTIVTNVNGVAGVKVDLRSSVSYPQFFRESATSTGSAISYDNATVPNGQASTLFSFEASRLVSASVEIEYAGQKQDGSGFLYGLSTTSTAHFSESLPTSEGTIMGARDNIRVRADTPLMVRWRPLDNSNDEFKPVSDGGAGPTNGFLLLHVNGTANVAYSIRFILNYECIPKTDTSGFIRTGSSPVDIQMLSTARSLLSQVSSFVDLSSMAAPIPKAITTGLLLAGSEAWRRYSTPVVNDGFHGIAYQL